MSEFETLNVWTGNKYGYRDVRIDGTRTERIWYARRTKDSKALDLLAQDTDVRVLAAVVRNWKTAPAVRDSFAGHPDVNIREGVAVRTKTEAVLLQLAVDKAYTVRRALTAMNDSGGRKDPVPSSVLDILTEQQDVVFPYAMTALGAEIEPGTPMKEIHPRILADVVKQTKDTELLTVLAYHGIYHVRRAVAESAFTPEQVYFDTLLCDPDPSVAAAALNRFPLAQRPALLMGREEYGNMMHLLEQLSEAGLDLSTVDGAVEKFSQSWFGRARQAVAKYVTDEDMILDYLTDQNPYTRAAIAQNPRVSEEWQRKLVNSTDQIVAVGACGGALSQAVALEALANCGEKDYPRLAGLVTCENLPMELRIQTALGCRSVKVRGAFADSLSPKQAAELIGSGNKKLAELLSKRMVKNILS